MTIIATLDEEILAGSPGAHFTQSAPWTYAAYLGGSSSGVFRTTDRQGGFAGRYYDRRSIWGGIARQYSQWGALTAERIAAITGHAAQTPGGQMATLETENALEPAELVALAECGWVRRGGHPRQPTVTMALPYTPASQPTSSEYGVLSWPRGGGGLAALDAIDPSSLRRAVAPFDRMSRVERTAAYAAFSDAGRVRVVSVNRADGHVAAGAIMLSFGRRAWLAEIFGPSSSHSSASARLVEAAANAAHEAGADTLTTPDLSAPLEARIVPAVHDLVVGPGYALRRTMNAARDRLREPF